MPKIPVGQWAPDSAVVDSNVMADVVNVFPTALGYGPVRGLSPVSTPLPTGDAKGGIGVQRADLSWDFYAGTATKIYRYNTATHGWTDVSNPTTSYSVGAEAYWSFFTDGVKLYATHVNAPLQVIAIDGGTTFANVGGNPPLAAFGAAVSEFIVLAGLANDPNSIQWSAIGNPNFWTPGLNLSDLQRFPDGGPVTAFAGGDYGVVFQERAIRSMIFAAGTPEVFQIAKVEDGRGAVSAWSTIQIGSRIFFVDRTGLFMFTGGQSQAIGTGRVNEWFSTHVNTTGLKRVQAVADTRGPRILWAIKTSTGVAESNLLDTVIVYDYELNKWSKLNIGVRLLFATSLAAMSLDALTGSLDDPALPSLDSAAFAGGEATLAAFDVENKMAFFEGEFLETFFETPDIFAARPDKSFVSGIRVDTDANDVRAAVGLRNGLDDVIQWENETARNRRKFCPSRARGRYHRGRIRIPAGALWTYVSALEINPKDVGE